MIRFIKQFVFKAVNSFCKKALKVRGVKIGINSNILGLPVIKIPRGASISIGSNTTLISSPLFYGMTISKVRLIAESNVARIEIGNDVGMSSNSIQCSKLVKIGDRCMIGPNVHIRDSDGHIPGPNGTWPGSLHQAELAKAVIIEEGCFIGFAAIILKGVTVGKGSVIAAGAVITRDVPAGHLAFGNPMQIRPLPDSLKYQEKVGNFT